MLLQDVTKILKVLPASFGAVASQDDLTQRRVGQIGEVIGAVEDVTTDEEEKDDSIAEKRIEEAHDIIHRVAAGGRERRGRWRRSARRRGWERRRAGRRRAAG